MRSQSYHKLLAYFRLFRLFEATLISATSAMTLLFLGIVDLVVMGGVFTSVLTSAIGVYCWNDVLDIFEDGVSHPDRPLVQGIISSQESKLLGTFFFILSTIILFFTNFYMIPLMLLGVVIGISYSIFSKHQFLLKNSTVSITTGIFVLAIPPLFGKDYNTLFFYFDLSLVLILFSYEILKDIRDVRGDLHATYRTLPIIIGRSKASLISYLLFMSSCLVISYGFFSENFQVEAIISLITAFLLILPFYWFIQDPKDTKADFLRYLTVGILFASLSAVAMLMMLRIGVELPSSIF